MTAQVAKDVQDDVNAAHVQKEPRLALRDRQHPLGCPGAEPSESTDTLHEYAGAGVCVGSGAARGVGGVRDTAWVSERNVLGGELEPCGDDPVTGFYRDGCCNTGPEDLGSHTICAVVTAEFLEHQRRIGNDLITPVPYFRFPGLVPGDRWCVTAANWLRAHHDGAAAYVVLASTHERALDVVPIEALREHAIDVPATPGSLEE